MDIFELFDLLEKLEWKISVMYRNFQGIFQDDNETAELFKKMGVDEESHVDIVKFQRKILQQGVRKKVDVDLVEINSVFSKIDKIIKGSKKVTLEDALKLSCEIESSIAEHHYRTAVEYVNPDVAKLTKSLGASDEIHFGRLKEFIYKRFPGEDKDYFKDFVSMPNHIEPDSAVNIKIKEDEKILEVDQETVYNIDRMFGSYKNLGYYKILGIKQYDSANSIKKAYHKTVRDWHPDRFSNVTEELQKKLDTIISYINTAYTILKDDIQREKYNSFLMSGASKRYSILGLAQEKSIQGWSMMSIEDYIGGARFFKEAIGYSQKAKYYFYYSIALLKSNNLKTAEQAIHYALEKDSANPDYITEAGNIYLAMGDGSRAWYMFKKALSINPGHKKAKEGLSNATSSKKRSFFKK